MPKDRRLSSDLDALLAVPTQPEPQRRIVFDHATGEGWLTTPPAPATEPIDWSAHLRALGYDPALYDIDANGIRTSVWEAQAKGGEVITMRAIKARVVARRPGMGIDADALINEIRKHKPRKTLPPAGDATFVFVVSDLQIGKSDGDGTTGSVTRFLTAVDDALIRVKTLRKAGRDLGHLLILGVGDLVEGWGMYSNIEYLSELSRREQIRVTRRLLINAIGRMSREFEQVTVAAVGGNHGQFRRGNGDKGLLTDEADNDDIACFEQAAEVLSANPDTYGHITWHLGGDPLMKQVKASGWIVGVTHGHVARESGTAEQKIRRWYERQAAAGIFHPAVLVTGHYHHLRVASWGDYGRRGCTWLQAPSTDGGSEWYAASTGEHSAPGVLTFTITPEQRVCDIAIL